MDVCHCVDMGQHVSVCVQCLSLCGCQAQKGRFASPADGQKGRKNTIRSSSKVQLAVGGLPVDGAAQTQTLGFSVLHYIRHRIKIISKFKLDPHCTSDKGPSDKKGGGWRLKHTKIVRVI